MENNHIIKKIFKNRMNKENERKPRYATRKLSIGMVSCMLGFALLVSPATSFAEEVNAEEKVQIDLSDLEDEDLEKLTVDTDNLIDVDAIDEFIMTEEKASSPIISESNLESSISENENHTKYETLKERKTRDKVSKTIMAKDVTVDEENFKNIQESNVRKTAEDTSDYYVTEHGVGSGYYDVNKLFDHKDGLLCSGATATNMMHWRLKQNKENIDKYLSESPDNGVIRAEGKERKIQELNEMYGDYNDQSKFFDFIKSAFNGKPISAEQLLNMYINGYGYGITWEKAKNKERKNESGINFFKKVFDTNILTDYHYVTTHEDFSKTIKEALESDKVMGISYAADKYHGMGHIVTLWGADFDENDKVVGIYVTDSDDGESKLKDNKKVGMIRYGINMHGNLLRINGHKDPTSGAQIRHLYSLSTGKSQWEEYFKKNNNTHTAQHVESLPLGASEETLKRIQQQENTQNILSQNLSTNVDKTIEKPVEKVMTKEGVKTPEVKKEMSSPKVTVTKPKAETKKVESKVSVTPKKEEKVKTPSTKTTKVTKKVESKVSASPKKEEKVKTPSTKTTKETKKVDSKVSATPKKVEKAKTSTTKSVKTKTATKPSVKKVIKKETQDKNKKVQTTKEKVNVKKPSVTNTAKKVTKNITKTKDIKTEKKTSTITKAPSTRVNKSTTKKVETKKSTTLPTSKKVAKKTNSTVKSTVKKPTIMPRSAKVESAKTLKTSAKSTSSKKVSSKSSVKTTQNKRVIISKKSR